MPPLDVYGGLPTVADVTLSDSGRHIAIFANLDDGSRILVYDGNLQPQQQISADGIKFRDFRMLGDEFLLIYSSTTVDVSGFTADQYELTQAQFIPLDENSTAGAVFDGVPRLNNSVHGIHGVRNVDGEWRGYYGALEYKRETSGWVFDHGRPHLYEYDFAEADQRRIATSASEGSTRDWLVDTDGNVAATLDLNLHTGNWTIRNASRDELVDGSSRVGAVGLVGLGADGDTLIYALEDEAAGETEWYEVPLSGGQPVPFLADVEVSRIYWDRNTGKFLGYQEADGEERQVFVDPELQQRAQDIVSSFPGQNARIVEWSNALQQAIVHTQGNRDSGTWYLIDLAAQRALRIGADYPQITPAQVGAISTVPYTAQDGLEMVGILTLPPGREAEDLPVIVLPHGGPHSHDGTGFDWWAQAFASRGYAVFQPNFRGSSGYGADFERAGYGEWGRKMQTDISDGLAHIAEQGIVDPSRACIVGASYGGYAALAGVTLQQGLYRCAVSVAGVTDLERLADTANYESGGGGPLFRRSYERELGPRSGWDAISPRQQAASADAPILLIHGLNDTVVPFDQSRVMADALDDADKPYRLVELEGEDHWLSLAETRQQMLREAVAFVEEHNPAD
ncbi:S9 family peptidase [Aurantiacibacter sp. MUD11]|uniref:alpha/beta hydrolase family protein n=1 Tax=Aurantiacibacter sp. MUD11 TaxID=3003265 RepID=UPI0022AA24BC|nr:S9 family peptidase [Aurantiacibacter sp. MUD11]WAT18033.1 S9 family peptidase [Aurantiacibacter sp. MUD11]